MLKLAFRIFIYRTDKRYSIKIFIEWYSKYSNVVLLLWLQSLIFLYKARLAKKNN